MASAASLSLSGADTAPDPLALKPLVGNWQEFASPYLVVSSRIIGDGIEGKRDVGGS